ncbi:Gfo/Idh/MocA family protein [Kitasatospora sp. NPDC058201]|uniref:Gfo/Idh/MocA family protein n=1 Tax=Streptomycetaceae TaxID=2062 RepID=UPI002E7828EB|nr:Gfo/Idh/MocA family oxidoreductase [Streptomyces sp. BE303]
MRVAVVGLGWAGRTIWLPRLAAHPAFRVTAVVEPGPVAAEHVPEGAELLADADLLGPDVDLAVVAVPNHLHTPVAERLLARGIPVFLEKPVCLSAAEADRLAAAERAGGAVLLAGSAARYREDVSALIEVAAEIGPIRHVDLAWVRASGVPDAGGWFTSRRHSGGGALVDLGWHLLDTAATVLGGPVRFLDVLGSVSADFVNDGARSAGWRGTEGPDGEGDVEDTARGFLTTDTGVSVAVRASWASHEPVDTTRITVEGATGSATLVCTFGFSPNRRVPRLTRTRDGVTTDVPLHGESVGAEYVRQLDALPALLADPASRGAAVTQAHYTISVIERLYAGARAPRPRLADEATALAV